MYVHVTSDRRGPARNRAGGGGGGRPERTPGAPERAPAPAPAAGPGPPRAPLHPGGVASGHGARICLATVRGVSPPSEPPGGREKGYLYRSLSPGVSFYLFA